MRVSLAHGTSCESLSQSVKTLRSLAQAQAVTRVLRVLAVRRPPSPPLGSPHSMAPSRDDGALGAVMDPAVTARAAGRSAESTTLLI